MMKWNTASYDARHSFVFRYGEEVLDLLNPQAGERILDVGCGTGHLTSKIAHSGAEVIGLDSSAEMIAAARAAYPLLQFEQADVANFSFDEPFNAIFSNAALHWVTSAEDAVICMARALKSGGRFVVEFGGKGNLQNLQNAVVQAVCEIAGIEAEPGRYYPSISQYSTLLERHGLEVQTAALFNRRTPLEGGEQGLRNWIELFDHAILGQVPALQREFVLQRAEEKLRPVLFHENQWFADYRRLRITARKAVSK